MDSVLLIYYFDIFCFYLSIPQKLYLFPIIDKFIEGHIDPLVLQTDGHMDIKIDRTYAVCLF